MLCASAWLDSCQFSRFTFKLCTIHVRFPRSRCTSDLKHIWLEVFSPLSEQQNLTQAILHEGLDKAPLQSPMDGFGLAHSFFAQQSSGLAEGKQKIPKKITENDWQYIKHVEYPQAAKFYSNPWLHTDLEYCLHESEIWKQSPNSRYMCNTFLVHGARCVIATKIFMNTDSLQEILAASEKNLKKTPVLHNTNMAQKHCLCIQTAGHAGKSDIQNQKRICYTAIWHIN